MTPIVLLFLCGVMLLGFEVFVPGGILGLIGGALMLGGCVLAFVDYGSTGGLLAVGAAMLLVGLMLWFEFKILPKTPLGSRLFLRSAVTGRSQPAPAEAGAVVGRTGRALTTLAPSGYVSVDGRRYEAFSRTGFVEKDAAVSVVGVDTFRLIVQLSEPNKTSETQS